MGLVGGFACELDGTHIQYVTLLGKMGNYSKAFIMSYDPKQQYNAAVNVVLNDEAFILMFGDIYQASF